MRDVGPNEGEHSQEDVIHTTGKGVVSDNAISNSSAPPLT